MCVQPRIRGRHIGHSDGDHRSGKCIHMGGFGFHDFNRLFCETEGGFDERIHILKLRGEGPDSFHALSM